MRYILMTRMLDASERWFQSIRLVTQKFMHMICLFLCAVVQSISMKTVTFGEIQINQVQNVSLYLGHHRGFLNTMQRSMLRLRDIKNMYEDSRYNNMKQMVQVVQRIVEHEEVDSVEIRIGDGCVSNVFMKDLLTMIEYAFNTKKTASVTRGGETLVLFKDGMSNPSFDETLQCTENWA